MKTSFGETNFGELTLSLTSLSILFLISFSLSFSQVFNSGGCPELKIPFTRDVEESRTSGHLTQSTVTDNKNWFSALNNISIAQRMRNQVFWLPHQMDYRGRCTPTPAFLTHHGPDLTRGLITFANKKPVGEKGEAVGAWELVHMTIDNLRLHISLLNTITGPGNPLVRSFDC